MTGIASPPRPVWQYSGSSASWLALFTVATFGPFAHKGSPFRVGASRKTIAARCGQLPKTLQNQLTRLRNAEVLSGDGRGLVVNIGGALPADAWGEGVRPPRAPPADVLAADLRPAAKRCAVGLWSFADYDDDGGEIIVYPTHAQLAERTGQGVEAIRKQLRALRDCDFYDAAYVLRSVVPESTTLVKTGTQVVKTGIKVVKTGTRKNRDIGRKNRDIGRKNGDVRVVKTGTHNLQEPCKGLTPTSHNAGRLAEEHHGQGVLVHPEAAGDAYADWWDSMTKIRAAALREAGLRPGLVRLDHKRRKMLEARVSDYGGTNVSMGLMVATKVVEVAALQLAVFGRFSSKNFDRTILLSPSTFLKPDHFARLAERSPDDLRALKARRARERDSPAFGPAKPSAKPTGPSQPSEQADARRALAKSNPGLLKRALGRAAVCWVCAVNSGTLTPTDCGHAV